MHASLEEYYEILQGQDKAEGTLQRYQGGLEAYSSWLDEEELSPHDITTRDLQRYLSWLKTDREYAPKTIRGYFSAISGYYSDLEAAGELDEDPTEAITLADYAARETLKEQATKERRVWLTQDQLRQVVENVPAPTIRNRLMVLFQYYTILRRQEVVDVTLDDLDREQRQVQVRGKHDTVHTAHWQPKLDSLLSAWLDSGYRAASPYAEESPYLFVPDSGPQVSGDRLNKIVVQAARNAGIQEVLYEDAAGRNRYKYTSHALRHSFAMHWLQNGGSLDDLSKHLAHSSVTTTEIYGEILKERASEEYEQYAPNIDFDM